MEIRVENPKIMSNSHTKSLNNDVTVNSTTLEHVNQLIYLGDLVTDNGSKSKICSRMAKAQNSLTRLITSHMTNPSPLPRFKTKPSKINNHIISIFLYTCESWKLDTYLDTREKVSLIGDGMSSTTVRNRLQAEK